MGHKLIRLEYILFNRGQGRGLLQAALLTVTEHQDLTWNELEHFLHLVFTDRILASPTGKKNKHFEISQTLVRTGRIPVVGITNTEVGKASIGDVSKS